MSHVSSLGTTCWPNVWRSPLRLAHDWSRRSRKLLWDIVVSFLGGSRKVWSLTALGLPSQTQIHTHFEPGLYAALRWPIPLKPLAFPGFRESWQSRFRLNFSLQPQFRAISSLQKSVPSHPAVCLPRCVEAGMCCGPFYHVVSCAAVRRVTVTFRWFEEHACVVSPILVPEGLKNRIRVSPQTAEDLKSTDAHADLSSIYDKAGL